MQEKHQIEYPNSQLLVLRRIEGKEEVLLSELGINDLQQLFFFLDNIITQRGRNIPRREDFNPEAESVWEISFNASDPENHPFTNPAKLTDDMLVYLARCVQGQLVNAEYTLYS